MESVTKIALLGAQFYDLEFGVQRVIGGAALTHDWGHSGSGKDDDINIELAIKGFIGYYETEGYKIFTEFERDMIIELIKATRYPYLLECGELSLPQQILRDSDILQGLFVQNYINGVALAIAKEANIPADKMLAGQEGFWTGTKYCTEWAKDLSASKLPDVLAKVNVVSKFF